MFLYVLQGITPKDFKDNQGEILLSFGLDHLIGECDGAAVSEFQGNGEVPPGLLVIPRPRWEINRNGILQPAASFDPPQVDTTAQVWRIGNPQSVWIGLDPRQVPEPVGLLRAKHVGGAQVPDASGKKWMIPVARSSAVAKSTLPVNYDFRMDGAAIPKPKQDFEQLWEVAGYIDDLLQDPSADFAELATLLVSVLAVNYRVSPMELSVMLNVGNRAVFDDKAIEMMALIVTNSPLIEEANKEAADAKKNDSETGPPSGTSSTDGDATQESQPDTALAGQH